MLKVKIKKATLFKGSDGNIVPQFSHKLPSFYTIPIATVMFYL